jgi:hypothetical protein
MLERDIEKGERILAISGTQMTHKNQIKLATTQRQTRRLFHGQKRAENHLTRDDSNYIFRDRPAIPVSIFLKLASNRSNLHMPASKNYP